MEISEAIKKALPIFLKHKDSEDEYIVNIFVEDGLSLSFARKIVIFMPIAFGRVILSELNVNVSDVYEYTQKKGIFTDKQQKKLNDEIVYVESLKLALDITSKKVMGEAFQAIAFRSTEVKGVSAMELEGVKPQDVILTPVEVLWEFDLDEQPDILQMPPEKNWWEFWK